jgi:hypothetical protein
MTDSGRGLGISRMRGAAHGFTIVPVSTSDTTSEAYADTCPANAPDLPDYASIPEAASAPEPSAPVVKALPTVSAAKRRGYASHAAAEARRTDT